MTTPAKVGIACRGQRNYFGVRRQNVPLQQASLILHDAHRFRSWSMSQKFAPLLKSLRGGGYQSRLSNFSKECPRSFTPLWQHPSPGGGHANLYNVKINTWIAHGIVRAIYTDTTTASVSDSAVNGSTIARAQKNISSCWIDIYQSS